MHLYLEQPLSCDPMEPCKKKIKLSKEPGAEPVEEAPVSPVAFHLNVPSLPPHQETTTINTLVHTDNFNDNEQPFAQSPVHQEAQINQEVSPLEHPQNLTTRVISSAKPNFTYTDLITLALKDKTSLTVSGIYQWIT